MKQPLAYVHPEAKIAPNVVIEPFVTIDKNVVIGEGTRIGSNVTILEGARIGKNCNICCSSFITSSYFHMFRCCYLRNSSRPKIQRGRNNR